MAEWGKPGGSAVVGIHGLTANCFHMAAVSEFLAAKGRHVLAYDVRGRGDSAPAENPSNMVHHGKDAVEILNSLQAEKVVLMGYSMGAFIGAIAAGLTDKVAGLVLFDGGGLLTREDAEKLIPALARMEKVFQSAEEYVEAAKPNYASLGLPWTSYIDAAVRHEVGPRDGQFKYKGNARSVKEDLLDIGEYDHKEIYGKVACPVLLVHAQGGLGQGPSLYSEASYEITRKYLPGLTFIQTKANHYTMMLDDQPELNRQVEEFISRCGV